TAAPPRKSHFRRRSPPTRRGAIQTQGKQKEPVMFTHETLESRRLLSVSVAYDAASGNLTVQGSRNADNVLVTINDYHYFQIGRPIEHGQSNSMSYMQGVTVWDGGEQVYNNLAARQKVKSVDVLGSGGDDQITVAMENTNVAVRTYGEQGNDTLIASACSARGSDVFGGAGNDLLSITYCTGSTGATIDGGSEDDVIDVSSSSDSASDGKIFGGDGNDQITLAAEFGKRGFVVSGGAGDDVITGSDLSDQLFGDSGNDL